jgi:dTDP-4-amino-4,6-dideoxygalactose transaminase
LLEDAAQAYGASVDGVRCGALGDAATFSFFPTKNLPCFGDGGLITTSSTEVDHLCRVLRFHGSEDKVTFTHVGYNSRLDELQAAVLRLFLGEIDGWNAERREAAARYEELGLGELCELPADEPGHVYHMYVVRSPERDRFREALAAAGIGNASYYVTPLHLQPALRYLGWQAGSLPETEKASAENLALPMWAGIPAATQERVVSVIREAAAVRA